MRVVAFFVFIFLSVNLQAAISLEAGEWQLTSSGNPGMTIYTKKIPAQPIRAVRGEFILENTSMESVLNVLTRTEALLKWFPVLKEAKLLQTTDEDGISIMYMISELPWPVKNRDVIVRTKIWYEKATGTVYMKSSNLEGYMPEVDGLVRIPSTLTNYKIINDGNGRVRIQVTTHTDPGGNIPKWLANVLVTQLPKLVYVRLKDAVEKESKNNDEFDSVFVFGKEVDL